VTGVAVGHVGLRRTALGHVLCADLRDRAQAAAYIADEDWRPWVTRAVLALIRPGDHVAMVGAGAGWHAIPAADRMGPCGMLTAIEPDAEAAALLARAAALNGLAGRMRIERRAVAATDGALRLRIRGAAAPCARLDAIFPPGARLDVLTINASGREAAALSGARRLIAENPRIAVLSAAGPGLVAQADAMDLVARPAAAAGPSAPARWMLLTPPGAGARFGAGGEVV